ncbi:hypothetical protein QBC39DRAFT_30455 [Podospora conica]|nr:hypothetical protein QBC39DRAFT_30455 [Schizothecium conicum]
METDSLILDWEEHRAPLTPPQSQRGDWDNGTLPNDVHDNLATVQDLATQAFALKLEGIQDVVLSSYHRIFSYGFLEGWKQHANAISMNDIKPDAFPPTFAPAHPKTASEFSVSSPAQSPTIIPDMTNTPINATLVDIGPRHVPIEATIVDVEPERIPIDKPDIHLNTTHHLRNTTAATIKRENTPINTTIATIKPEHTVCKTDRLITTTQPLIDITPPDTPRPTSGLPSANPHRLYPFLPSPGTILQRPYIPTTPLYGILPPCAITPTLPSLSPTPQPSYPNLYVPPSSSADLSPPTPPGSSSCLLTSVDTRPARPPTASRSILVGPISDDVCMDWTTTAYAPHAYFSAKFGGDKIQESWYYEDVDTEARYMRLTFWEEKTAEWAVEFFRGGYPCGGGVVWGWMWRG